MTRLQPNQAGELARLLREGTPNIELEPGEYVVDELVVGATLGIRGAGPAKTTVRSSGRALFQIYDGGGVTLQGLTLRGGRADAGGAVRVSNVVSVKLEHCVLEGNTAVSFRGGAVSADGEAKLELVRCVLRDNQCERGGAVALGDDAQAIIDRCLFVQNRATLGGALWAGDRATLTVSSSTFVRNQAEHPQGGDVLFVTGSRSGGPAVTLVNSVVTEPRALVNNPERPGTVTLAHSIAPETGIGVVDGGGSLFAHADLVEVDGGLWVLRAGSPGTGAAETNQVALNAVDFLGHPLLRNGRADLGALAGS